MTSHLDSARRRQLGFVDNGTSAPPLPCQTDLPDHVYARHLIAAAAPRDRELRASMRSLAHTVSLDELEDSDELDDLEEFPEENDDSTCRLSDQALANEAAGHVAEALRAAAAAEQRATTDNDPDVDAFIDLAETRGGARIDVRTGGRVPARLASARDLIARMAPKVLVPVAAIVMLVIAMGGTWSTASANPTAPWSAARPPPPPSTAARGAAPVEVPRVTSTSMIDDLTMPRTKISRKDLIGKLNLNTASEDQLMMLPTVGPAKAERIVTWRKKNGGFKRTADLRRVKGFGYKTFKKLEPFLDTKGDTTLAAR